MMLHRRHVSPRESGAALTMVLGLLALLALWSVTAVTTTSQRDTNCRE